MEFSVDELDDGGGDGFGDVTGLHEDGDVIREIFLNECGRGGAVFFLAIGAGDEEGSVEFFEEFKYPGFAWDADAEFTADFRERFYDLCWERIFVWVESNGELAGPKCFCEEFSLRRDVRGDLFEHSVVGDEDEGGSFCRSVFREEEVVDGFRVCEVSEDPVARAAGEADESAGIKATSNVNEFRAANHIL